VGIFAFRTTSGPIVSFSPVKLEAAIQANIRHAGQFFAMVLQGPVNMCEVTENILFRYADSLREITDCQFLVAQ
jgi:hypothetical protein